MLNLGFFLRFFENLAPVMQCNSKILDDTKGSPLAITHANDLCSSQIWCFYTYM